MKNYLDALQNIMDNGVDREGRNGVTRSLFALQLRFNLKDGFPAVTTKKLAFKAVKGELLWFLSGSGNEGDLREIMEKDKTIWTANAEADYWKHKARFPGDLGRIYGVQWRSWLYRDSNGAMVYFDQIGRLVQKLKNNPYDRRLIVSAWNAGEINDEMMALPPCHVMFQCYVDDKSRLSLHMVQRSCDMFLGVPFNIASYALLLHMLASVCDLWPHELVISFNDAHIYKPHFKAVEEQLSRDPLPLPQIQLNPDVKSINGFNMEDIQLANYFYHPSIKAKMIV